MRAKQQKRGLLRITISDDAVADLRRLRGRRSQLAEGIIEYKALTARLLAMENDAEAAAALPRVRARLDDWSRKVAELDIAVSQAKARAAKRENHGEAEQQQIRV